MRNLNIPILMYHSIEKMPKSTIMRSLHVSPSKFKFQMWLLNFLGYKAMSMRKLMPYLNGEKTGKVVGVTFDDGYQNNLINAAPILNKYKFSATCYLVSKRIGLSNVWDLEKKITQRPLMNYKEVQNWLDLGMDIGAHSRTHPDLTKLSIKNLKNEIIKCKTDLENEFNIPIVDFCYPFGRLDDSIVKLVSTAGFSSATTMNRGRVSPKNNYFSLPRIPITNRTLPHLFLVKISTKYEDKRGQ